MAPDTDHVGRIPKTAFKVSIILFMALSILAALGRFFIRVRYQRSQFTVDDGFLLFGIICMIASVSTIFVFIDSLYLLEGLASGTISYFAAPPDYVQQAQKVHKYSTISLVLSWISIVSVKFSFLFLFRKLVDRKPFEKKYWWGVLVFNVIISLFGVTVYFDACPTFNTMEVLSCGSGSRAASATRYSIAQIVLDIFGDLLILVIPIYLVLKTKLRWSQKLALLSSLCLTIFIIIMAIIKASGLRHGSDIDNIWEIFFQEVSCEVGLIMTALLAFRTFFVARNNEKSRSTPKPQSQRSQETSGSKLTSDTLTLIKKLNPVSWLRKTSWWSAGFREKGSNDSVNMTSKGLNAQKTGISTFIQGSVYTNFGEDDMPDMPEIRQPPPAASASDSRTILSSESTLRGDREDLWPLRTPTPGAKAIMVHNDISFFTSRNSTSSDYIDSRMV